MNLLFFLLVFICHIPALPYESLHACHTVDSSELHAKEILEHCFQKPLDNISLHLLTGGYSNALNFHVCAFHKHYVLRMYVSPRPEELIQKEFYALTEAAKAQIAPQIYYLSLDDQAVVMDFIPGKTLSIEQAKQPEFIVKIAQTLRKTHAIDKNPYLHMSLQQHFACPFVNLEKSALVDEAMQIIREGQTELETISTQKVTIHGEPHPRNIFVTDHGIQFIDWSETSWEDPFYDLSYFALTHAYNEQEEKMLLENYLQHFPNQKELYRYFLVKKINLARLCLCCQSLCHELCNSQSQYIDDSAPLKSWFDYTHLFAENNQQLPAQFFSEMSRCSLALAKNTK